MRTLSVAAPSPAPRTDLAHDPSFRERFEVAKNHLVLARRATGLGLEPLAKQELLRARGEVDASLRILKRPPHTSRADAGVLRLVQMVGHLKSDLQKSLAALSSH